MGSVDSWDNPYVFISKVHYYIMGAHLLCTNYIDSFLSRLKILNQIPIVYINGFMACYFSTPCKKLQWDTKNEPL